MSVGTACQKGCGYPYMQSPRVARESAAMSSPTVLVIDDHSGFRSCARQLLEREGYRVVGEACDGESGITCAEQIHPELVLVDVYLPGIDGFEVASRLAKLEEAPEIVLISSRARA